jgi:hypothetical protein
VAGLRFRDVENLTLHKARFDNCGGGDGHENTAPTDEVHSMDNVVVATDYIGPAQSPEAGAAK